MKLDNLFDLEFNKLNLKKVRLKRDPAKPILPYEGYILRENKFKRVIDKAYDTMGDISRNVKNAAYKVGRGYQKLQRGASAFKSFGQGDIGQLAAPRENKNMYGFLKKAGLSDTTIFHLRNGTLPFATISIGGANFKVSFKNNKFIFNKV
jgi:hypothetical protein